jgi:hypothetical protein
VLLPSMLPSALERLLYGGLTIHLQHPHFMSADGAELGSGLDGLGPVKLCTLGDWTSEPS